MKGITKSSRVNSAIQAIQHMNNGMTVAEACRVVGIPRSSYYYILNNNPEAIAEIQDIIDSSNREQLGLILLSKTELLRKIIEDGLSNQTKPRDRLAIYSKLGQALDDLTRKMQVEEGYGRQVIELRSPETSLQESRFASNDGAIDRE